MKVSKAFLFTIVFCAFIFPNCKKEISGSIDCELLKQGLATNNVKSINNALSNTLSSSSDSKEGLDELAETISEECNMKATLLCFDCIKTIPPQSEMKLSFLQTNDSVKKVIDLFYTKDNKMTVIDIHK